MLCVSRIRDVSDRARRGVLPSVPLLFGLSVPVVDGSDVDMGDHTPTLPRGKRAIRCPSAPTIKQRNWSGLLEGIWIRIAAWVHATPGPHRQEWPTHPDPLARGRVSAGLRGRPIATHPYVPYGTHLRHDHTYPRNRGDRSTWNKLRHTVRSARVSSPPSTYLVRQLPSMLESPHH
jgi:hypothetical protein